MHTSKTSSPSASIAPKPVLTFQMGRFILTGTSDVDFDEEWSKTKEGYIALDFKAAARFNHLADDRAARVLDRIFVKRYPAPRKLLPSFLDPHQVEGITWVLTRGRSYLAHAPGAGKTCQAVTAAILTDGPGQTVFIVPPSLTANWAREVMLWTSELQGDHDWSSVAVVPESARQEYTGWAADFLIVPDSMLTKPWVLEKLTAIEKKFLAVDEASRFKEATAQRTIALFGGQLKDGRTSKGIVGSTRHAVLMDGSPMPNRPMELWAPTFAMSPLSIDFMDQQSFGFRYCGARVNPFGRWEFKHSSNEEELKARLQKDFMHVVSEEKLLHPERKRSMLFMNKDVRSSAHKTWEKKHLSKLNFSDVNENFSQGDMARFRAELGLKKVSWVADYVSDRLSTKGESILLFAWHRGVVLELEKRLSKYKPGVIMGGTDASLREIYFKNFQEGLTKLLIMNIAAGGRGHNLQRADRVVFAEFSWTDELNRQCEKRASRRGRDQDLSVRCDYVIAPNSMDEPVLSGVFRKAERVKRVIG